MEATPALDRDTNNRQISPDRVSMLYYLISEAQVYQGVPSDPDGLGDPFNSCWSLVRVINYPSVHSTLPKNSL